MEKYERGAVLGEGTFGAVYKAVQKETGQVVALKKVKATNAKEGIDVPALREIKLLKELHHPNVIHLMDAFPHKKNLILVLECAESDLEAVIKDRTIVLSPADIKSYMQMLLSGLAACHAHWVLHRDVKPNNCLLMADGQLRLADFGLARIHGSPNERGRPYTTQVFARWYRAPELIYGSIQYGPSVDIWAAGCIFAELLLRRPWFPGDSDIDMLSRIFQVLGTPTPENWPDVQLLPAYLEFNPTRATPLKNSFPMASPDTLELLARMMSLNPADRPTAEEALAHRYFTNQPTPTRHTKLPRPLSRESAPLQQAKAHILKIEKVERPDGAESPEGQPPRKRAMISKAGMDALLAGTTSPPAA